MAIHATTLIHHVDAAPNQRRAHTAIGADVAARNRRRRGEDVFFLSRGELGPLFPRAAK